MICIPLRRSALSTLNIHAQYLIPVIIYLNRDDRFRTRFPLVQVASQLGYINIIERSIKSPVIRHYGSLPRGGTHKEGDAIRHVTVGVLRIDAQLTKAVQRK